MSIGPGEELLGQGNIVGEKSVGGNIDSRDGGGCLVNIYRHLYPTPLELGRTLRPELLPTTIFPLGRGKLGIELLHFGGFYHLFEFNSLHRCSIFLLEGLDEMGDDVLGRDIGVEFGEVDHTRLHRSDSVFLQFGGLDLEVFLQHFDIGADEDGAVVEALVATLGECVAGEFAPLAEDIVAAADLGLQTILCHSFLQH